MQSRSDVYKNRNGDEYWFEAVWPNRVKFVMPGESLKYGRMGGKEGEDGIKPSDLGMFDPYGGPYICVGSMVEGREVLKISAIEDGFILELGEE
jgi:hypothetical protein